MKEIFFYSADRRFYFKQKKNLRQLIILIVANERRKLQHLSFVFCSDEYLLKINQDYLGHDYYTDVITFDLSDNEMIKGEIYISLDRAKDNARQIKVGYQAELVRVILHGVLHLCGYKDKTKSEISEMRNAEDKYLRLFAKMKSNA